MDPIRRVTWRVIGHIHRCGACSPVEHKHAMLDILIWHQCLTVWNSLQEPGHDYIWSENDNGDLVCFVGRDAWLRASGHVLGSNVTLTFADKTCPGAEPSFPEIVKWGTLDKTCSIITMHDVQPNCPTVGSCTYARIPPPPPPCPSNDSSALDVDWLRCKSHRIINGSRIGILPTSILNRGLNATNAYTPDASHSYGAQVRTWFVVYCSYMCIYSHGFIRCRYSLCVKAYAYFEIAQFTVICKANV